MNGFENEKSEKIKKEPWDSSTEKARILKLEDFGNPETIEENIKPCRTAKNRFEAAQILKNIISNSPILTNKSGTKARINLNTIGKMVSSEAVRSSINQEAHYLAVANLDKIFMNSIEPWKFELNPNKNNQGLKERKYSYAPLEYCNSILIVKFTIKSYQDENLMDKIYSIEAMDIYLEKIN
jgi:hypothetical protein